MLEFPLLFGSITIPNRVVFQPMEGCDCETDGAPGELTVKKYMNAARSGAGLIWLEATAVCPEGRTNPRQMMLTEANLPQYQKLVADMRAAAKEETGTDPVLILQLTHSGRQSVVPMIAYRHPLYEATRPVTDANIVTDEYLDTLPALYAKTAKLAVEAGFDGVDVKSCHGYLFQELLSGFNRPGRYGGSYENRTRLYFDAINAVKAAVPTDYPVVTRLSVTDAIPYPYGFGTNEKGDLDLTEPDRLIGDLLGLGITMLNVTLGNPYYNSFVNRPYRAPAGAPETPETGLARFETVEKHIKERFPSLLVVGSGLSFYRADLIERAESQLERGICDLVGFGRMTLAYPSFYRDHLAGKFDPKKTCVACSKCTALMRAKCVAGCAVFNDYYRELYKEKVACKK